MLAGKKSADSQLAAPWQRSWEVEFFLPSCWECGTDIFFQQQKKKTKNALKVFTYHCYGLNIAFCENVSLGAPEKHQLMQSKTDLTKIISV